MPFGQFDHPPDVRERERDVRDCPGSEQRRQRPVSHYWLRLRDGFRHFGVSKLLT